MGPEVEKERNESHRKQHLVERNHTEKTPNHAKNRNHNEKAQHLRKQNHPNRNPKKLGGGGRRPPPPSFLGAAAEGRRSYLGGSASSDAELFHSGCGFSHSLKSYLRGFLQLDVACGALHFFPFSACGPIASFHANFYFSSWT